MIQTFSLLTNFGRTSLCCGKVCTIYLKPKKLVDRMRTLNKVISRNPYYIERSCELLLSTMQYGVFARLLMQKENLRALTYRSLQSSESRSGWNPWHLPSLNLSVCACSRVRYSLQDESCPNLVDSDNPSLRQVWIEFRELDIIGQMALSCRFADENLTCLSLVSPPATCQSPAKLDSAVLLTWAISDAASQSSMKALIGCLRTSSISYCLVRLT